MRKRSIILICLGGAIIIALMFLLTRAPHPSTPKSHPANTQTEAETGDQVGQFALQNSQSLYDLLLENQYDSVQDEIGQYIKSSIDPKITTANTGTAQADAAGTIRFSVSVASPYNKKFDVQIARDHDRLVFSVVGTPYSTVINPYGGQSDNY